MIKLQDHSTAAQSILLRSNSALTALAVDAALFSVWEPLLLKAAKSNQSQ